MATSKPALSSVEFHSQHAPGSRDCVQPAAGESEPSRGEIRCCVVKQMSYLTGEPRREFFSPKDAAKRKRVNRIAKLKQCKLDARREQWLSQGNRCLSEERKQVAQHSTQNEERPVPAENTEASKDATVKGSECLLHGVVSSEFLSEGNTVAKQSHVTFFPTPYLVGSVKKGHSKIIQNLNVGETGKPELLSQALPDYDSYKTRRRPGDPDSSARECDEAREGGTTHQRCSGAPGDLLCSSNVPDSMCFRTDNSQRCSGSSVIRLDHIPGGPKLLDDEGVVLSQKSGRGVWRAACRNDPSSCLNSTFVSSIMAETGPDVEDLSFPHETEDDWELAADALSVPGSFLSKSTSQLPEFAPEGKEMVEQKEKGSGTSNLQNGILKPEYKCKGAGLGIKSRGVGGRAWRPDDTSRPPTLPPLSKQLSFPQESGTSVWNGTQQNRSLWGPPPVPSYCPICTEELDLTDSSFFPCSCGFRLCLFCHHRISSDDGRCPGCRKIYSPDAAMKLSHTTFWLSV